MSVPWSSAAPATLSHLSLLGVAGAALDHGTDIMIRQKPSMPTPPAIRFPQIMDRGRVCIWTLSCLHRKTDGEENKISSTRREEY